MDRPPTGTVQAFNPCRPKLLKKRAVSSCVLGIERHHADRQRHPRHLPELLCQAESPDRRVEPAGSPQRSDTDVHQRRHGAVQERLHRRRGASLQAGDDQPEMRARGRQAQRPGQCRLYRPASHLLRDARQLLVRRLLQGRRHRAGLEPDHQGIRPAGRQAAGHRPFLRRRGLRPVAEDRGAGRAQDHPHPDRRQFLADGRYRPLRPLLRDLLRPRPRRARRPAGQPRPGRRPLHRDLEPRVHAVRADHAGQADRPAQALHRHRHGPGAAGGRPPGQARQLRHRPAAHADPGLRRRHQGQRRRPARGLAPGHRRPPARRRPS